MPVEEKLVDVWSLIDIPACDEGMKLAAIFMAACRQALAKVGVEQTVNLRGDFHFKYSKFAAHYEVCDRCSGLDQVVGVK
jgi:hypothetical protein